MLLLHQCYNLQRYTPKSHGTSSNPFAHAKWLTTMSMLTAPQTPGMANNESSLLYLFKRDSPDLPDVGVPPCSRIGMESAFLVQSWALPQVIGSLTLRSTTLKAWFASKLQNVGEEGEILKQCISPKWGATWALIKEPKASWDQQYGTSGSSETLWEVHEPSSVGELYALAMFVLYKQVQNDSGLDHRRLPNLKWPDYYNVEERRFFLLYRFLEFLELYCFGAGAVRVDPPTDDSKLLSWKNSPGGEMHAAIRKFQKGELFGHHIIKDNNTTYEKALLTHVDNDWHPGTLWGYEAQTSASADKEVGFIVDEGTDAHQVFTRLVNSVFQGVQDYFTQGPNPEYTASAAMCASLGWPKGVIITKVCTRIRKRVRRRVDRIENVLEYVREDKAPWIWLDTSLAGRNESNHTNQADQNNQANQTDLADQTNPTEQTDYSCHPVLQLETWVGNLTNEDAGYAAHLFALLRHNHRRSRDFVEDLSALFAPFRRLNTINSERSRSLIEVFDDQTETASHPSHLAKIEGLASELDGMSAEDARAILHLVHRGFGTCRDYLDELKVIFAPLQQRSVEELERATQIKKVFEAIDKEAEVMDIG